MNIVDYVYDECARQHVTNYGDFAKAIRFASGPISDFSEFVQVIGNLVEPDKNLWVRGSTLRRSEVGFLHGTVEPCKVADLPSRFDRWVCLAETAEVQDVEMIVKMFLDIHPFADGNGRTASILRNRMLGTLNDPTPLPFYYGSA